MAAGILATAAGAGQGLEDVLNRLMMESRLKQMSDQTNAAQAETVRSHTANESIDRDRIAAMERERVSRDALTARNNQDQSEARARDDGRALGESIPADAFLPTGDPAISQMQRGGVGSLLKMKSSMPSTSTVGGMTMPGDENPSAAQASTAEASSPIGMIKLRSAAQGEKALADERALATQKEQGARDAETIRHNKVTENKPPPIDHVLIQTPEGYMPRSAAAATLAAGGRVDVPESATTKNRRDMASAVGSHFDDVSSLIDEADQKGLLGPLKGRTFVEFMSGKVGSTGDAKNDELLGELRTQLGMIRTGVASLHGRAGANVGIAKDIEKKMDESYMDPAQLRGALKGLKSWVDKYATKPGAEAAPGGDPYAEYLARTKK